MKLEDEAHEWVFEKNGHRWSNNDNSAGDNYRSFIEGSNSKHNQYEMIKAQMEILNSFYYGEDLKDDEIMNFYIELHAEIKEELHSKLKKLKNG